MAPGNCRSHPGAAAQMLAGSRAGPGAVHSTVTDGRSELITCRIPARVTVGAGRTVAGRHSRRKVRTPSGGMLANGQAQQAGFVPAQGDGKWHRKDTAAGARVLAARVKRRGKSSPHSWQHGWLGKPQSEQGQIGGEGLSFPIKTPRVGC